MNGVATFGITSWRSLPVICWPATGFHILENRKATIAYWQDQQSTIAGDRARLISNWAKGNAVLC